jgi:Fe2+ transport system protein FeoA
VSHRVCLSARGLALVAFAAAVPAIGVSAANSGSYEQPPSFSAAQVLPPNLLASPNYTIGNQVGLANFQYVFNVDTRWGPFSVNGLDLMRVRAREVAATVALEQIDSVGTFANAAGRTALKPLATAKDLVTAPGRTVGDTVRGVGNLFGSVDAAVGATDPHKEGVVASVTGGATARRKLAYDFGVDPNTSFPPLHDELTRLATANAIGETTTNAGLAFVTGGAGIAISVGGTSRTLRLALRDKTASQLEKEGRQRLAAMGVPGGTTEAFYANPHLSPTDKAIVVAALMNLGAAGGREVFIESAAGTQSIEMGFFYRRQAELIAAYDSKIAPVTAFVRLGAAPMLETGEGTVTILPVDYLYWSPPLEALIAGAGRGGQLWITGRASTKATSQLAARGWTVVPKAGGKLGE